ncbi:microtubule-binding protein, putative [Leishmania panamensis]|uniref:TRAF3-interacting protein 1 n=1 Tax=Leishmania panamensis TaxID=5679 RepID=A0A088S9F4_LEIPA|nr:microtubule-binding protein, putative [Leishmania panamensis]AIN98261.1 microtubule-binding protein, putative [Leishmania panamensis]
MEAIIEKTQKELGVVIQAPKLTEKLLSRPPFRYIHDIVMSVMRATGFPDGIFNADQLDSSKVTDKKAKVQFLEKLIAAVEAATGTPIAARPSKIVAGEEAEKTNELFQQLAKCATLSPAQRESALQKVKSGDKQVAAAPSPALSAPAAADDRALSSNKEVTQAKAALQGSEDEHMKRRGEERRRRHEEKRREAERAKEKTVTESSSRTKEESSQAAATTASSEIERHRHREDKKRESVDAVDTATTSARKAPPRPKPTHEVIEAQRAAADAAPAVSVIREGKRGKADVESEDDEKADWQKVAEQYEVKPAARTAAVGEDAEVKGLLGQQALKAKRDQEAAARRAEVSSDGAAPADGGIIIRSNKNTASRGSGSHVLSDGDLNQLREQLQLLTKASNPLGKFLETIHDDIDSMTRELEMWRSESRSQALAAAEARRQTEETLQEIHANLQNLEDAISDQMLKTNNLRQTILANDAAMEAMTRTIVNPDIAAQ